MNDLRASVLERLNREPKLIENLDAEGGDFLKASLQIKFWKRRSGGQGGTAFSAVWGWRFIGADCVYF